MAATSIQMKSNANAYPIAAGTQIVPKLANTGTENHSNSRSDGYRRIQRATASNGMIITAS